MRRPETLLLAVIVLPCLSVACDVGTNGPTATAWQGDLIAVDSANPLTGTVAAVSEGNRTEAGIDISHAQPGSVYAWRIRAGTCETPGAVVGGMAAYHELTADESGRAADETVLSTTLRSRNQYHGVVMDATAAIVACGELFSLS